MPLQKLTLLLALLLALAEAAAVKGQDTKRGMGGGGVALGNAQNTRWMYDWGNTPPGDIANYNGEFTPMIWSSNTSNIQSRVNNILSYKDDLNVQYVLGFNEPERPDQANMSVSQAVAVWDIMDDQLSARASSW